MVHVTTVKTLFIHYKYISIYTPPAPPSDVYQKVPTGPQPLEIFYTRDKPFEDRFSLSTQVENFYPLLTLTITVSIPVSQYLCTDPLVGQVKEWKPS